MSDKTFSYDLDINQGATFSRSLAWAADGAPVDLTNVTARMQLRRTHGAGAALVDLTTENGGISIDAAAGGVTFRLSATQTAGLSGVGVYDLELTFLTGVVHRLVEGKFNVSPEVTR